MMFVLLSVCIYKGLRMKSGNRGKLGQKPFINALLRPNLNEILLESLVDPTIAGEWWTF